MIRRQCGYTLLEVVVAFAIVALSLSALFESFSMTLRRSEKVRNLSRAELLAESVLDRLAADVPVAPPGSQGSDGDCRWQVRSQPIPRTPGDHPPMLTALRVGIEVTCGDAGSLGRASLETVLLAQAK